MGFTTWLSMWFGGDGPTVSVLAHLQDPELRISLHFESEIGLHSESECDQTRMTRTLMTNTVEIHVNQNSSIKIHRRAHHTPHDSPSNGCKCLVRIEFAVKTKDNNKPFVYDTKCTHLASPATWQSSHASITQIEWTKNRSFLGRSRWFDEMPTPVQCISDMMPANQSKEWIQSNRRMVNLKHEQDENVI